MKTPHIKKKNNQRRMIILKLRFSMLQIIKNVSEMRGN